MEVYRRYLEHDSDDKDHALSRCIHRYGVNPTFASKHLYMTYTIICDASAVL
jgi:hypothetical protein